LVAGTVDVVRIATGTVRGVRFLSSTGVGRREGERRRLLDLLDGARQERSGVLLIRGEAGIGKSTLIDEAVAAADGMSVLRVRGVESEAELPYAALHRLLRPALPALPRLAAPQAGALRRALGMEPDQGTTGSWSRSPCSACWKRGVPTGRCSASWTTHTGSMPHRPGH
jgi:hypothetical protein